MTTEKMMPPKAAPADAPMAPPPMAPAIELPKLDFSALTLDWAQYQHQWQLSADKSYYSLHFVYFCTRAVCPEHQYMNLFVPAAYLNADGTVCENGSCGGYTARTAPVILQNECAGWRSSTPGEVNEEYIKAGFVYVFSGARSRGLPDGVGKAPAPVVDLKAAVRMLRRNSAMIPGDKDRIISCGTSGGGQMSSILGASGDMDWYLPYLAEIGAAGVEQGPDGRFVSTISDRIYASQCYCPITDINNADLAYAWLRYDVGENEVVDMFGRASEFSPFQLALQEDAAKAFCTYLNGLELTDPQGNSLSFDVNADGALNPRAGSYVRQILRNLSNAFNAWIADRTQPDGSVSYQRQDGGPTAPVKTLTYPSLDAYLATLKYTDRWLRRNEDGSYSITDLAAFLCGTNLCRNKDIPGFDTFHLTAENDAFGTAEERAAHYASIGAVMAEHYDRYRTMDGFADCDVDAYIAQYNRADIREQTYYMNSTHILLNAAKGEERTGIARHWRIRSGSADEHTSFSVGYNLALSANMAGADSVDYALVWEAPHCSADGSGTGSFTAWVRSIC